MDRATKHLLGEILVIALSAIVCRADTWEEVEAFGEAKADWLKELLALSNGIPSHDTFCRVFTPLDQQAVGKCVTECMPGVCGPPPYIVLE